MKGTVLPNGLLLAASLTIIYLAFYFINPALNFSTGVGFAMSIILPIVFMAKGIREEREVNEGIITFGEAFATAFPIFAIGYILFTLVNILHLNIDADFKALGEQISLENAKAIFEKMQSYMGDNEEVRAEMAKGMAELDNNPPKITNGLMFMGMMIGLVFPGAILAAIMAAVMKKK